MCNSPANSYKGTTKRGVPSTSISEVPCGRNRNRCIWCIPSVVQTPSTALQLYGTSHLHSSVSTSISTGISACCENEGSYLVCMQVQVDTLYKEMSRVENLRREQDDNDMHCWKRADLNMHSLLVKLR